MLTTSKQKKPMGNIRLPTKLDGMVVRKAAETV